jgi:hypothetical protein
MAGHLAQNSRSHTATLDISTGAELSAASIHCQGHQCWMSNLVARKYNHVNFYNKYLLLLEYTDEQGSRACHNRSGRGPEKGCMSE